MPISLQRRRAKSEFLPPRLPPAAGSDARAPWPGRLLVALGPMRHRMRRVHPTKGGWVFLSTLLAVAMAAMNTGNNLLYLVLAAMLALVAVSSVLSEWSIRGLTVSRSLEQDAFAGEPVAGRWQLRNPRALAAAFDIRLEEVCGRHASLVGAAQADIPELRAGESLVVPALWCFAHRGVHRVELVRISTAWPFGIFRKWYEREAQMDVLVFPPRTTGLARSSAHGGVGGTNAVGVQRLRPTGSGEFLGLREYRPVDDARLIHWRSSARTGRLLSAERADLGSLESVELRVDAPTSGDQRARSLLFEKRIERAAGRLWQLIDDGAQVQMVLLAERLPVARDAAGRRALLRVLALVELPKSGS